MAKVLVVDDSAVSRANLKRILADGGHTVVGEAADGCEGYDKYKALRPDVVTMDITMPKMNGLDCLKKIMADHGTAKIVMITAIGQGAKILEALNAGAKHYITKPFEPDKVLAAVKDVAG